MQRASHDDQALSEVRLDTPVAHFVCIRQRTAHATRRPDTLTH